MKTELFEIALQPEEFENAGVSSSYACGRKTFENEAFRKQWRHVNHVISLTEFSSNRNFEIIEWCLLKFCFKWTGPQCQYIYHNIFLTTGWGSDSSSSRHCIWLSAAGYAERRQGEKRYLKMSVLTLALILGEANTMGIYLLVGGWLKEV